MPLDDAELEQISKMLERGGKMLAAHCQQCQSPLFKFEGKEVCPVCEYRARQAPLQASKTATEASSQPPATTDLQGARQRVSLDEAITETLSNVALKMSGETDLARILVELECIERGLRIIQLIRGVGLPSKYLDSKK